MIELSKATIKAQGDLVMEWSEVHTYKSQCFSLLRFEFSSGQSLCVKVCQIAC